MFNPDKPDKSHDAVAEGRHSARLYKLLLESLKEDRKERDYYKIYWLTKKT